MLHRVGTLLLCLLGVSFAAINCPRFLPGTIAVSPSSINRNPTTRSLSVEMQYLSDDFGPADMRWCYWSIPPDKTASAMNPTLRLRPGDTLYLTLYNSVGQDLMRPLSTYNRTTCATMVSMGSPHATNVHFHGFHVSPLCTHDEVLHTMIGTGQFFTYRIDVPQQQPPGLYWYHPHVHGSSSSQVLGGASGAIVVEGLEEFFPELGGLTEQLLVIRSPLLPLKYPVARGYPPWDISVNGVDVSFPDYVPAAIPFDIGGNASSAYRESRQVWRILNSCSDRALNLSLLASKANVSIALLSFTVVAIDGIPVEKMFSTLFLVIPPAGRREVIVSIPQNRSSVDHNETSFFLKTWAIDTGPDGDLEPEQPIATIVNSLWASNLSVIPRYNGAPKSINDILPFSNNTRVKRRSFVFSEKVNPLAGDAGTIFFLTEKSKFATPETFVMSRPPSVFVKIGSQEEWFIENVALELHSFHIHQTHFKVLEYNKIPVRKGGPAVDYIFGSVEAATATYDTMMLPQAISSENTSILLQMDFRGTIAGIGVFHCHMLVHEDQGMMQKVVFYNPTETESPTDQRTMSRRSATFSSDKSGSASFSRSTAFSVTTSVSRKNKTASSTFSTTQSGTAPETRGSLTETLSFIETNTYTRTVSSSRWRTDTMTLTKSFFSSTLSISSGTSRSVSSVLTQTIQQMKSQTSSNSHQRRRHPRTATEMLSASLTEAPNLLSREHTPTFLKPEAPPEAEAPPIVLDGIQPSDVAIPVGISAGVGVILFFLFRFTCRGGKKNLTPQPATTQEFDKPMLFFEEADEEMQEYSPPTIIQFAGRQPPPIPLSDLFSERLKRSSTS
jgi:FtsP/CotA-like multicopper oxidase with cupredoxin domain